MRNLKASQFLPVPVLVAILALVWMIVAAKFTLLGWVAFLTWGAYFLSGIGTKSAVREAISYTLGIFLGAAIVLVGTYLTPVLGFYAFPVVVAVAAFIIVYLELVPWFDMAPGYFIGAAAFFAAGAKPDVTTALSVFVPGILGLGLGVLTGYLRLNVLKIKGVDKS